MDPLLYGRLEWGWEDPMLSLHLDASSEPGTRTTQQVPLHVAFALSQFISVVHSVEKS